MLLFIRIRRWIFSRLLLVSSGAGHLCSSGCRSQREESISKTGTKLVVLFVWGIRCYPWNTYMFPGFTETPKLSPELSLFGSHSVWNCDDAIRRFVVKGDSSSWMDGWANGWVRAQAGVMSGLHWISESVCRWVSQCLGVWVHVWVGEWYWYLFIYCNWVSTRWQWSVDLYENRKETAQKEKRYTKQYKNKEYTKQKKVQNKKQTYKKILWNVCRVMSKYVSN